MRFGIKIHFFIRNLYSTFYQVTIEVQKAIVLITMDNKRKIKKLSAVKLDLSFLFIKCVYDGYDGY